MNFNGNLRIAECDENGTVTGPWLGLLNPVKCELVTPAAENVDEVSRLIDSAGQLLSRGQIPKFTALNLSTSTLRDKRMLAIAFNGTAVAYSQDSGTVTDEVVSATELGDWIKLSKRHVTLTAVKDAATGAVTYDPDADYTFDSKAGFIKPLPGGAITANEDLKVSFTHVALSGTTVQGSKVPSKLVRVEIQLADLVDQSESYFVCPLYQAASAGNKDIFGKTVINADLAGAMLVPPEGTAIATETGGAPYIFTSLDS